MNGVRCLVILIMLALLPATGHAKWWIFGQSENEISTRYLYLNGISYDELGDRVTIYRETLENGQVTLRGKAATSSSAVGSVQVSLNGKESWEKARKAADGSFEYSFRPETGKKYIIYVKIIDTAGKTNDVDATRKEITISDQNISALLRQAMDELIAAYRAEDPARFMALVGEDFAADPTVLDRAIRRDFTLFDNIDLRCTLNNVTAANGKIYAGFTFSRKLTSARSGQTLSDRGASEFIFTLGEKGPLVSSMKSPLIFGLSDASNVATGTLPTDGQTIVVGSDGTVSLGTPGSGTAAPAGIDVVSDLTVLPDPPQSMKHHQITLTFTTDTLLPYTVAVEEATSPSGPWLRLPASGITLMNPTTVRVMSTNIASQGIFLYYRIVIVKDAVESRPSNVAVWDNR